MNIILIFLSYGKVKETAIDMEKGKARIRKLSRNLQKIENRIAIYHVKFQLPNQKADREEHHEKKKRIPVSIMLLVFLHFF